MDCAYRQLHADYFGRSGSIRNERDALRVDVREKTKKTTKKTTKKVKLDNNDGMAWSKTTRMEGGGSGGGGDEEEEEDDNFGGGYVMEGDEDYDNDEDDSIVEEQLERQRKNRKLHKNAKRANDNPRTNVRRQSRIGRATTETTTTTTTKSPKIEGSASNSTVQGGGGSIALFGRAIASFSLRGGTAATSPRCCMFLILDNADRILSWKRYGSIHPLTQLFMLPSVMGIDLTLIFISQSSIFQYSRE
jgi:hypothetical protein